MPFCSWCQIESETEDICAWCKRPLARFKYSGFDFIREVEPAGDRVVPIVASVVLIAFLGLLGFAAFANRPNAAQTKLQPIGEMSSATPGAGSSGPSASAISALKAPSGQPSTPAVERTVYRPVAQASYQKPIAERASSQSWDDTKIVPIVLDKATLKISKDSTGMIVCHGTLTINLHSDLVLTSVRVLFQSEEGPVVFRAFTGEAEDPNVHEIVELSPGLSKLRIIAEDADLKTLQGRLKRITISGRLGAEQVSGSVSISD